MNKSLHGYLEYFKKYTIEMILNLEKDDIDNFELALGKRGKIIEEMKQFNFDNSEFKKICEELDILDMDNQLKMIMSEKREELKNEIIKLKKSQSASNAYNLGFNNINIFSKKV